MVLYWQYVALLGVHWFADFVCQTDWQAKNKSKDISALSAHVLSYTAVLGFWTCFLFERPSFLLFAFIMLNGALHFCTDYVTSRINSHLWAKGDTHNFFVSVGFDQYIHQVTLAVTAFYFLR